MTNNEAIKILEMERIFRNGSNSKVEAIDIAISSLKENDKLKAEKEELELENVCANHVIDKLKAEIEQLKWKLSSVETQRDLKGYDAKRNADIMSSQLKIIEQLKSELEQSEITRNKQIDVLLQEIKQLESIINTYEVKKDFKEFCDRRDREESKLKFREVK